MTKFSRALIIGGGIAGLSVAVALARKGVHSDVVEIADAPLGASIGLSGRATEALEELGVYDECYDTGAPWERGSTVASVNDATGRLISPSPERPEWPGAKTAIGVYRPVLLQILADTAKRLGVEIQRGVTAQTIEDAGNTSSVIFTNGDERHYDFVVGADGIGSQTRNVLFPDAEKPTYAGQMSVRWMVPGPAIDGEGWYLGPVGRLGFYYLPHQRLTYVPAVISEPEYIRLNKEEIFSLYTRLLDSYTAPAIVELRRRLTPDADLIYRPFEWILLPEPWHRGRTILIGDAAHATTAHMGMGAGMALEDAVVLAQCIAAAATLTEAFDRFMKRRFARVRKVVETSLALSRLEQANAPRSENLALLNAAFEAIAQPY
jgi:2-polyprenyl-6-methoxyphenol hydroxylase-like FAD-dependent oxidoreductase